MSSKNRAFLRNKNHGRISSSITGCRMSSGYKLKGSSVQSIPVVSHHVSTDVQQTVSHVASPDR